MRAVPFGRPARLLWRRRPVHYRRPLVSQSALILVLAILLTLAFAALAGLTGGAWLERLLLHGAASP